MKPKELLIACYFERAGDQWLGFCLDYSLVAQADTLANAKDKLEEQIREYVYDATVGQDREHAGYLLRRRAPLKYWLKFYVTLYRQYRNHVAQVSKRRKAEHASVPLAPIGCHA
ncbi:hypothetical protein [Pseudoxanthomonas sp. Soil82]|uniref:hypothetical protein n=1 Tax=Pseudoxanthomonas sp. Soil82 TaxID=3157341 RepID=UPI00338DC89D